MRIAMLAPVAWRTPPTDYGPWERVTSLITEGLVEEGIDVTLFATADSITKAKLHSVCEIGYEADRRVNAKVAESLHISELFENADKFDLIHSNFDFLPLTYSGLVDTPVVTTIHGFSSPSIIPVYKKYNSRGYYVSISNADRSPELDYIATVYHGIDIERFSYSPTSEEYLLFFGRIHPDKGTKEAVEIAKATGKKLILAGIIHDQSYYEKHVEPYIDGDSISYIGSVGPEPRNKLLGGAAALLHPIGFEEPFGLSVVESMACGTPVIAFNKGSMPELIRDGYNGFIVENVDEAVAAVGKIDIIKRSDCRKAAEERFTAKRMVQDYIKIYKQIVNK